MDLHEIVVNFEVRKHVCKRPLLLLQLPFVISKPLLCYNRLQSAVAHGTCLLPCVSASSHHSYTYDVLSNTPRSDVAT